ncbi:hypothetical protein [Paraglaciecola polaris]|uniref:Uncharacterized protein n=1 Tax=Paraglaciecola polaris LMG 21857 TaxID=1129793 RepID=K6YHZ5_9ALTE|nr:hypothetical protein [Paraglaciecola polaris]GAC32324.1 hypothetical protein GPLA_1410 [Paraglaciecola polaris LMG 21857]
MYIQTNSALASLSAHSSVSQSSNEPHSNGNALPQTATLTDPATKNETYDFTSMSRREYNQLVKAGEVPLGYIVLPSDGIDLTSDTKAQMEAVQDEKMNFIDYYKSRISYRESTGQSTENFRDVLADLQKLQGKPMIPALTKSVDTYA